MENNLQPVPLRHVLRDLLTRQEILPRLPTGLLPLDCMLRGGLTRGELHLLAARPGMGRTTLALSWAMHLAKQGHPVLYLSPSISAEQIAARILCLQSGLPLTADRVFPPCPNGWEARLEAARAQLEDLPLTLCDAPLITVETIDRAVEQEHPEAVFVDDLFDLFGQDDPTAQDPLAACLPPFDKKAGNAVGALRDIAVRYPVALVALSRLRRPLSPERRPRLADLPLLGIDPCQCDTVLFLHKAPIKVEDGRDYDLDPIDLIVERNRWGPTGILNLRRANGRFQSGDEQS